MKTPRNHLLSHPLAGLVIVALLTASSAVAVLPEMAAQAVADEATHAGDPANFTNDLQHCNAALARAGLSQTERATLLVMLADIRKSGDCYDLAIKHYQAAAELDGVPVETKITALRGLGVTARELRQRQAAIKAFEAIIALPEVPRGAVAEAFVELINTHLFPCQYDWTPTDDALQAAIKTYERCKAMPEMTPAHRYASLTRIAAAQQKAGLYETAIATEQMLLNVKGLSTSDIEKTHAVIGDCYQALKNYKKAVAHYEHAINSDKYIVLNKLATSARLGKDYNRAMQAYADLVPMIDKVEAEDDYKRVTRLLVAMTQATRKMMQAPSTAEVFRSEGDKALGTLSLDDDI